MTTVFNVVRTKKTARIGWVWVGVSSICLRP